MTEEETAKVLAECDATDAEWAKLNPDMTGREMSVGVCLLASHAKRLADHCRKLVADDARLKEAIWPGLPPHVFTAEAPAQGFYEAVLEAFRTRPGRAAVENEQYAQVIQGGKRLPAPELSQDAAFAAFTLGELEAEIAKLTAERDRAIAAAKAAPTTADLERLSDLDRALPPMHYSTETMKRCCTTKPDGNGSCVLKADPLTCECKFYGATTTASALAELRTRLPAIIEQFRALLAERDKLQALKTYTHDRLTAAGVTADPESPHRAEGCRIGGRLDEVFAVREKLEAENVALRELLKEVYESWMAKTGVAHRSPHAICHSIQNLLGVVA